MGSMERKYTVDTDDFFLELSKGHLFDHSGVRKFGENPAVGATVESVWDGGGLYPWPTVAAPMNLVSSSGNDVGGGSGATLVRVQFLDDNYDSRQVDVVPNGVTPVAIADENGIAYDIIRVYRVAVLTAGAGGGAVGTLTVTDGTVRAQVIIGNEQTMMACFTVPRGWDGRVTYYRTAVGVGQEADIWLYQRDFGGVFRILDKVVLNADAFHMPMEPYTQLAEKTDIEMRASLRAGTEIVTGTFGLVMHQTDVSALPIFV